MATYYIVAAGTTGVPDPGNVNGYPQIGAGSAINALPGDVFIIDGAYNANTTIQTAGGAPCNVQVIFGQNITSVPFANQLSLNFSPNIVATVDIQAGVNAAPVQLVASQSDGITVNAADGARVGMILGSPDSDTIVAGNGVTFIGISMGDTAVANVTVGHDATFNIQVSMTGSSSEMILTAGDRATFNCGIDMPGMDADKSVVLGADATINGTVTMTGSGVPGDQNNMSFVAGDNAVITGSINMESSYTNNTLTLGANASVGTSIGMHSQFNINAIIIGPDSDIGTSITMTSGYSDNELSIGSNTVVGQTGNGSILMGSTYSENALALGNNITVMGDVNLGSGESRQLVQAGDNLTISQNLVVGGGNSDNAVDIGNGLTVGGSIIGSNNQSSSEYIDIGDGWHVVGNIAMAGGADSLILGAPAASETQQVITADGFGGNAISIEAPVGQEAAFGTAATSAGWAQNANGTWSPTGLNQNFFFNNFSYQVLLFDKSVNLANAPDFTVSKIFVTTDGLVQGGTGNDVMTVGYTDFQGDQIDDAANANDAIIGGGGSDTIQGGAGNDSIQGDGATPNGPVVNPLVRLTNVDNLQDSTAVEADNSRAVELIRLANGKLILLSTEQGGLTDGMSSYQLDSNPDSPSFGQIIPLGGTATNPATGGAGDLPAKIGTLSQTVNGAGFDQIEAIEGITLTNGNTFVYTADAAQQTIGVASIAPSGVLTEGASLTNANLNNVFDLSVTTVGGNPILVALAGGTSDSLITYSINPTTGALTQLDREVDGAGAGENFLAGGTGQVAGFVEAFTNSAGQSFVLAAGNDGAANGISLWSLDSAGALTFQNARADDANGAGEFDTQGNSLARDVFSSSSDATGLDDSAAATFAEIGGRTYVFVGGNDDDISIFRIDPDSLGDGTYDLTLVGQAEGFTTDISSLIFIPSGNSGTLVVGGEQAGLKCAAVVIDPATGVVSLDPDFRTVVDEADPDAELLDSEDMAYVDGVLVSASDNDDGVAVMTSASASNAGVGKSTGAAGNDLIDAGDGNDTVDGGAGNDTVAGGAGNDSIAGGYGDDSLVGGAGGDTLDGGLGSDTLVGGEGSDTLTGGAGDDDIAVGAGDLASGGTGMMCSPSTPRWQAMRASPLSAAKAVKI